MTAFFVNLLAWLGKPGFGEEPDTNRDHIRFARRLPKNSSTAVAAKVENQSKSGVR
jgi:hypothetical protein